MVNVLLIVTPVENARRNFSNPISSYGFRISLEGNFEIRLRRQLGRTSKIIID
jgi:hypothetical protein